ncbi:MAG: hypothetical protein HQM08_28645 [Candidatus Riflebacteria bacterium]|nr:hypothetical protein [Candidatus Riflebacteria bacterium]
MKWHSISEVAKIVNQSRQSVYKKLNHLTEEEKIKLGGNLVHEGKLCISSEGINLLFGVSTSDNQVDKKGDCLVDNEVVKMLRKHLTDKEKEVDRLDDILGKVLNQLEEERKLRGEERQRTDTILIKLSNDVSTLQKALEYKKSEFPTLNHQEMVKSKPVKTINLWKPEQPKNPLEGMSIFQRILVRFFRPEKLRQFDF